MSNPSFSNIDLWLFELAEGNLSQSQIEQLELFLLQNPDLDVDRDIWEMSKVNADPVVYPHQEELGKGKSSRRFALVGSSALLLLCLVGCLGYLGYESTGESNGQETVTAQNEQKFSEERRLMLSEIDALKSRVASLESEAAESQTENNADLTSLNELPSSVNASSHIVGSESGLNMASVNAISTPSNGTDYGNLETFVNLNIESNATAIVGIVNDPLNSFSPLTGVDDSQENSELESDVAVEFIEKKEAEHIPTSHDQTADKRTVTTANDGWSGGQKVEYHVSMRNKMARFGRSLQRMMDNPIALKNSRDPHYHVPGLSAQDLNFGSVGTLIAPRVQTLSRLQWYNHVNEQFSNQIAVDGYSHSMRGGIGLQLNHSLYSRGGLQVSNATFTYSPKISVNKKVSVEPSFRFKMGNKYLSDKDMDNATQVEFDRGNVQDYYNDGTQPIGKSLWYKDLGVGLNVNTKWFFASAQFDNIFNHRDNIYSTDLTNPRRAGTQFVATLGTDWENRKESMVLSPYMVYQKNEQLSEAWLGINYRLKWFTLGGAISSNLDPAASIGVKTKHVSVHYNADYTYSLMNNKRALSHQVTLRFLGKPSRFGKRLLNL